MVCWEGAPEGSRHSPGSLTGTFPFFSLKILFAVFQGQERGMEMLGNTPWSPLSQVLVRGTGCSQA